MSYSFSPTNIYIAGLIACAVSIIENSRNNYNDFGLGTNLVLGKEWWISKNWGIGLAGYYHYSKIPEKEDSYGVNNSIKNNYYGVAVTATYN